MRDVASGQVRVGRFGWRILLLLNPPWFKQPESPMFPKSRGAVKAKRGNEAANHGASMMHDGEASRACDRYTRMPKLLQQQLLDFLATI